MRIWKEVSFSFNNHYLGALTRLARTQLSKQCFKQVTFTSEQNLAFFLDLSMWLQNLHEILDTYLVYFSLLCSNKEHVVNLFVEVEWCTRRCEKRTLRTLFRHVITDTTLIYQTERMFHSFTINTVTTIFEWSFTNAGSLCTFWALGNCTIQCQSDDVCENQLILQSCKHTVILP